MAFPVTSLPSFAGAYGGVRRRWTSIREADLADASKTMTKINSLKLSS